ncbi:threonine--tRNA ligase [Chlamydiia bacterium]|nr:threonine--tRNA ligase [Chlamydiia bacterium]
MNTVNATIDGKNETLSEQTLFDYALKHHMTDAHQAVTVSVNGEFTDLSTTVNENDDIRFYEFDTAEGKEVFWHTTAHVLAQAVCRLWPEAKPTIGPPIDNGFYYDFHNLSLSESDFARIEKEMKAIIKQKFRPERRVFNSKQDALDTFASNPFKCELISEMSDDDTITAYKQGEFEDLCRGPHLSQLSKIKAVKLLKTSASYWRGDSDRETLTRIYGISFPDRVQLDAYVKYLEDIKKRDHKILGPKLGLFSFFDAAPGMPLFHPNGMFLWNTLNGFIRNIHDTYGYNEIKSPILMSRSLWEQSGHWDNYGDNMYTTTIEDREYAIKPMNCPGSILYYNSQMHSYRDLPVRISEIGTVHRVENSGSISGLLRVRCFHQDDAHVYLSTDQIENEIVSILDMIDDIYTTFGLSYHLELSTRPESKTIGSDEMWEKTTSALQNALDKKGAKYHINEGDGAFYGPKIDIHVHDSLKRTWQCGTIQLDMALPEKFDCKYIAQDGSSQQPVLIHRALLGSFERFMAILIEQFAGRFPLWISPSQVKIITVSDSHQAYAQTVYNRIKQDGWNVSLDESSATLSKKVRNAQLQQYNYILTVGNDEVTNNTVSLRTRNNKRVGAVTVDAFMTTIRQEKNEKQLVSPYDNENT